MLVTLAQLPAVQGCVAEKVSDALSRKIGSEVKVGNVSFGLFNRVIVDRVELKDKARQPLIKVSRISVSVDMLPLMKGKISISAAQLFGADVNIYKRSEHSDTNIQFLIDSLKSRDTTKHETPIDIHVGSLIVRNGCFSYNRLDKPVSEKFTPHHIKAQNISANIVVNQINDDSLSVAVKKLSLNERSGLSIKKLSFKLAAYDHSACLSDFFLSLPNSKIELQPLVATYRMRDKKILSPTLRYNGGLKSSSIDLRDLAAFFPILKKIDEKIDVSAAFVGNATELTISDIAASTQSGSASLIATAHLRNDGGLQQWTFTIPSLKVSGRQIEEVNAAMSNRLAFVERFGDVELSGYVSNAHRKIDAAGIIKTDIGEVALRLAGTRDCMEGHLKTDGLHLGRMLDDEKFGNVAADMRMKTTDGFKNDVSMTGNISTVSYNGYTYNDIKIDGSLRNGIVGGDMSINDVNARLSASGTANIKNGFDAANVVVDVKRLNLKAINVTNRFGNSFLSFKADANVRGRNFNTANGNVCVRDIVLVEVGSQHSLDSISEVVADNGELQFGDIHVLDSIMITARHSGDDHTVVINSDFAAATLSGTYNYESLAESLNALIYHYLPTCPGIRKPRRAIGNNFMLNARVSDTWWINKLLGTDIHVGRPLLINGTLRDATSTANLYITAPDFTYNGNSYRNGKLFMNTYGDSIHVKANIQTLGTDNSGYVLALEANAADNNLSTVLNFDNHGKRRIKGRVATTSHFYKAFDGKSTADMKIEDSDIMLGDTLWKVHPSNIVYRHDNVVFNHVSASHAGQFININGVGSLSSGDTVTVEMQDVDVAYILDMINFHSVDFGGKATGTAFVSGLFAKPNAAAALTVRDFTFETGEMGTLHANVLWNDSEKQIDIDALASDGLHSRTKIDGYVSPSKNYIDLIINATNAKAEFVQGFCGSFMDNVAATATGSLQVVGDLKHINLLGSMNTDGTLRIKPLNVTYRLANAPVHFVHDDIQFPSDTVYDEHGNMGVVKGGVHHNNLKHITYDINVQARNLLSFDTNSFGDGTFYGTAYATGRCDISGKSGEVVIDVDATTEDGTVITYNAAAPDVTSDHSFIHWRSSEKAVDESLSDSMAVETLPPPASIPADVRMNLAIDCTPDAELRVLMDNHSSDCIALRGSGGLQASWFNKGVFNLYGNYTVESGTYNLTIQNALKRDFKFLSGGTISFGGDPYNAPIDLKAQYSVAGVSLAGLNIGRSFSSGNVTVNCIMNISGTPKTPKVDFSLDMPNVGTDAKQMVMSLINSEEEMNQQVLYLLAVGRFYNQESNNSAAESARQSQTSLAMQSLLSGTVSQQITTMLGSALNISNWNIGANISTGDEGWNNAEYEGLLSGRALSGRLLFNGQFGYRDNPNATSSFIGDFDIQYLLVPSGAFSLNAYNKTNDRYFTRNSLTTQGLGIKLQKDFTTLSQLFGKSEKKDTLTTGKKRNVKKKKSK